MRSAVALTLVFIGLQQVDYSKGFFGFGGGIPGIPNINPRGQLGNCHLFGNVCNSEIIKITDIAPYNQMGFFVTPLIVADPTLNTKSCDAMCTCLTGKGGSCQNQVPFLNNNGCELLRFKCRCDEAYGPIQQAQAAIRLFTGKVCV